MHLFCNQLLICIIIWAKGTDGALNVNGEPCYEYLSRSWVIVILHMYFYIKQLSDFMENKVVLVCKGQWQTVFSKLWIKAKNKGIAMY